MTYAEMRTRVEALCSLEGWSDIPDQPDWGKLVNEALTQFSTRGEYVTDQSSFVTVAGTAEYSLLEVADTRDWLRVEAVIRGTTIPLVPSNPVERSIESETWFVDAQGAPTYWWLASPNTMRLHPIPDAVYTINVLGVRCEAELTAASATPAAFDRFHMDICRLAAAIHGETYASSEAQIAKVVLWREQADRAADECRLMLLSGRANTWTRQQYREPRRSVSL